MVTSFVSSPGRRVRPPRVVEPYSGWVTATCWSSPGVRPDGRESAIFACREIGSTIPDGLGNPEHVASAPPLRATDPSSRVRDGSPRLVDHATRDAGRTRQREIEFDALGQPGVGSFEPAGVALRHDLDGVRRRQKRVKLVAAVAIGRGVPLALAIAEADGGVGDWLPRLDIEDQSFDDAAWSEGDLDGSLIRTWHREARRLADAPIAPVGDEPSRARREIIEPRPSVLARGGPGRPGVALEANEHIRQPAPRDL